MGHHGGDTDTRRRILGAAERLFSKDGFDRTSTASVARAAGVPSGLVFYYFDTKVDLLVAVVRERAAAQPRLPEGTRERARDSGQPLVVLVGAMHGELTRYEQTRRLLFRELHSHPAVRELAQALAERATRFLAGEIAAVLGVPVDEAVAAARLVVHDILVRTQLHLELDAAVLALLERGLVAGRRAGR